MKTYQYYLDEVSKEAGYLSFSPSFMINIEIEKLAREAARRYATAAIKEHLSRAAENARTRTNDECTSIIVDRDSITNIDIKIV